MAKLKQFDGFWLPDSEVEIIPTLEKSARFFKGPTYQVDKFLGCLPYIKRFKTAIDVGAHCGLWARVMARTFKTLHAFEPVPEHAACLRLNVPDAVVHEYGLDDKCWTARMETGGWSTGNSHVDRDGDITASFRQMDLFRLEAIDFIKLDCEGYEFFALAGGAETIRRDKPCIIVEQKSGMAQKYGLGETDAVEILKAWGAVERFQMSGDYCLSWD